MTEVDLRNIKNREDMIRYFDGYTSGRSSEIGERKLNRPLVKTQLLETVAANDGQPSAHTRDVLGRGVQLTSLEAGLFSVVDLQANVVSFAERLNPRVIALYSTDEARAFNSWIHPYVDNNPDLDYVWLSGITFNSLWKYVVQSTDSHRYVALSFSHAKIFDIDRDRLSDEDEDEDSDSSSDSITERRATTSRLADRISALQGKLDDLQELYNPFYAISRLRLPALSGRGGHDFYDDGRVTNRSSSFRDHKSQLLFMAKVYEHLLAATEKRTWYSVEEVASSSRQLYQLTGAPVIINFREPLTAFVFQHWVETTFRRKRNRFRLWGKPTWLGPTKVHVHGVDRHLWQPLFLELTAKGCTLILPRGTCGNVVHRFITNLQRYVDPALDAYIGDKQYRHLVEDAIRKALSGPASG